MADAAACKEEFFSTCVESLREALSTVDVNDDEARVEAEIKASKVHWSELASTYVTAMETQLVESRQPRRWRGQAWWKQWRSGMRGWQRNMWWCFRVCKRGIPDGFFVDEKDVGPDHVQKLLRWMIDEDGKPYLAEWKLSSEKPFAKGAQAQLFHAHVVFSNGKRVERWVLKVFKEGTSLRFLQRLLPPSMLNNKHTQDKGGLLIAGCNAIGGARLLKANGRFAFLMVRAWGDLRKLIVIRMLHDNNQGAPFLNNVVDWCMFCIATDMQSLHAKGIVYRDLKAANVLICGVDEKLKVDPFLLNPCNFFAIVADYECSVGVVEIGFWRALGILLDMKNRNYCENPEIFSKEADVYSYGMTCYEILTGNIPFEELRRNNNNGVIGGARPILPTHTTPQIMDMVKRCWHKDLALRPTFDQILEILHPLMLELWEACGP